MDDHRRDRDDVRVGGVGSRVRVAGTSVHEVGVFFSHTDRDRTTTIAAHRHDDNYEVNLAQARIFAAGLAEHIEKCSTSIEIAQSRAFRARADKAESRAREHESDAAVLRKELYEMYRQIDNMTARFPELKGDPSLRN